MATTLAALQAENSQFEFVIAISGYGHLFSNATESAVQAAWSTTDWATKTVIRGITIEIDNQQSIDPWNPFRGGGKVILRVQPDASDTFGIDLARSDAGAETFLDETATRTSSIFVGYADGFPFTGEAHCGTEVFDYGFIAGRWLHGTLGDVQGAARGKYVAHGVKDSVTTYGAVRFAEHHRVSVQNNGVRFRPIVSQYPRSWAGRRVSVWMHTKNPVTGALNSKADALCVFVGELTEPRDDSDDGWATVLFEHALDSIPKTMLLRDQWTARVDYGIQLKTGQVFKFKDFNGTTTLEATDLTVVSSGASGTNQVDAGFYGHEEIASILNAWWGGEHAAARISGSYFMVSPEDVNGSPRSVIHYTMPGTSADQMSFEITWPFPMGALGYSPSYTGYYAPGVCGSHVFVSPYTLKPFGFALPEVNTGGSFSASLKIENETGIFVGQNATLPSSARAMLSELELAQNQWGLFILECDSPRVLLATVQGGKLRKIRVLTAALAGDLTDGSTLELVSATVSIGQGPPRLRQIFVHEGKLSTVMKWLFYSTGTNGYNHPDYDVLPQGQGLGIPYDQLGDGFELSCDAMPGAQDAITLVMDKPRTLQDLISADLVIRNAHLVFREGKFRFVSWTSPASAIATVALDQSNKAEPIDARISHRSAAILDSSWVRNYVKVNYNRSIDKAIGAGEDVFLATPVIIEDATSIDDRGGVAAPVTLDLRNVFNDTDEVGQGVRALTAGFASWQTMWSRPLWRARRSIAPTLFEGFGVGECALVDDPDIRDPETGRRGITQRPALVVGHRYRINVPQAPEKIKFAGEVDLAFTHADRVFAYAPAAEVDETKNDGGFTAGYDGVRTFQFKQHEHSNSDETVDVGSFAVDDEVFIIETDGDDPSNVDYERFTITNVDTANNRATVDVAPTVWGGAKRWRMVYAPYPYVQASQHLASYQAGSNGTIAETSVADHYGGYALAPDATTQADSYDHTKLARLPAQVSYGGGGAGGGTARDCGHDKELALLIDQMMDHQTRRSAAALSTTATASTNSSNDGWQILRVDEHYIGNIIYGNGVNRYLWIAPHWRSTGIAGTPVPVQIRVWVSGYPPSGDSNVNLDNAAPGYIIKAPAAGNSWSVLSDDSTWRGDSPQAYPLGNFNGHEWVYVIIEGTKSASTIGLSELREGERFES